MNAVKQALPAFVVAGIIGSLGIFYKSGTYSILAVAAAMNALMYGMRYCEIKDPEDHSFYDGVMIFALLVLVCEFFYKIELDEINFSYWPDIAFCILLVAGGIMSFRVYKNYIQD